jgi:cytochrome c-type biogenesis protein CcmH
VLTARARTDGTVLLILVFIAFTALVVAGCTSRSEPISLEERESVAQGIDKSLMCPVCPSETIDQSQVEIARQMRVMVREKLAQGESRNEILQFFVDRYGPGILAEPPRSGFNLLVWIVPPVALLLGSGILAMTVLAMRRGHHRYAEKEAPPATAELEPYLSAVDQEIQRLTRGNMGGPPQTVPEGPDKNVFGGRGE